METSVALFKALLYSSVPLLNGNGFFIYSPHFRNYVFVSHGFSVSTAKVAIKELEEEGYIVITRTYISGNVVFELV